MPQRVEVKGLGIVEFPDGTPPAVIKAAIRKAITPKTVSEQLKLLPTVGEMIKTRLEGNYGIPTNAVISPRKPDYTSQPTISPGPRDYTKDPLAQFAINMAAGFAMPVNRIGRVTPELIKDTMERPTGKTFYRVHWKDSPAFSRENATNAPWGEDALRDPGYSTWESPERLLDYFNKRGGIPSDDAADIIAFRGAEIGTGPDLEPLAIPRMFPAPRTFKPSEFEALVNRSPKRQ